MIEVVNVASVIPLEVEISLSQLREACLEIGESLNRLGFRLSPQAVEHFSDFHLNDP